MVEASSSSIASRDLDGAHAAAAVELDLAAALEQGDDGGCGSCSSRSPQRTITLLEAPFQESASRWIASAAAATAISIADEARTTVFPEKCYSHVVLLVRVVQRHRGRFVRVKGST